MIKEGNFVKINNNNYLIDKVENNYINIISENGTHNKNINSQYAFITEGIPFTTVPPKVSIGDNIIILYQYDRTFSIEKVEYVSSHKVIMTNKGLYHSHSYFKYDLKLLNLLQEISQLKHDLSNLENKYE